MEVLKTLRKEVTKISRSLWYKDETACVLCGREYGPICSTCTEDYFHPELGRCKGCGKLILSTKIHCCDCELGRGPQQLDRVTAWGHYSGELREFIKSLKFKAHPLGVRKIARPFSDWAISQLPPVDGLVAVPMHAARLAERGYNQAEVICSALHWELGLPLLPGVERIEPTASQVPLTRLGRLQNLNGAFYVRHPEYFKERSIWLVDDVTTTGATLEAVAKVLRESGVRSIFGLCLAAGLEKKLVPS